MYKKLDLEFIRQQFPSFTESPLDSTAFFENAGGSYLCRQVIDRLNDYYLHNRVQPYYPNPVSTRAGAMMDESYPSLARWLNVSPEEVYFGPSTSQNTYVLANAMLGWLQPGDEIIVTNQDHEANSGVWRHLVERGVDVREWRVDPRDGRLHIEALQPLITSKSRLLVFPHCSNILGEINPVAQICRLARAHGVRTVVDGVSYAGHGLPDIVELETDIYLFSLYKVYGPHQGVMAIRPEMAELLSNQGHFFNAAVREKRLYPAGPDHAQVAAAAGVGQYFESVYRHHYGEETSVTPAARSKAVRGLLHDAEQGQIATLLEFLRAHPAARIIGPDMPDNRAPTVSVWVEGREPLDLAQKLGEHGVLCGAGHFYSWRLLETMGLDPEVGVLRFSLVHYTSEQDTNRLIDRLERLL